MKQSDQVPKRARVDILTKLTLDRLLKLSGGVDPGRVMVVSYESIKFARDCGIDVWYLAGSMCFQHVIHDHGTPEEQQRLRDMKVGYPW